MSLEKIVALVPMRHESVRVPGKITALWQASRCITTS